MFQSTLAVFQKDMRLEIRNRFGINTVLMFLAATLFILLFSIRNERLTEGLTASLIWLVLVFTAVIALGRAFIAEAEQQTMLLLQIHAKPTAVYSGKLLFNFLFIWISTLIAATLFCVLTNSSPTWSMLFTILTLGALGLSGTTTLLSAIIAKAGNKGALLAVLALPLLFPLLLPAVAATKSALLDVSWRMIQDELVTLLSFAGTVITASVLLFEYVWND